MVCEACKANIFTNFGDQRWCYLCEKKWIHVYKYICILLAYAWMCLCWYVQYIYILILNSKFYLLW